MSCPVVSSSAWPLRGHWRSEPSIILADEPTGALDTQTGEDIMALFQELNDQGITIVMVTHDPEVAQCAQRTIQIRDGLIVDDGVDRRKVTHESQRAFDGARRLAG